ncbi:MAG: hypothetical protein GY851_07375 [bacterium]|nr:hypothetical protein [bacterium]
MGTHERVPRCIPFTAGQTDFPPDTAQTGTAMQRAENHLINYRMATQIYMYSGPPDTGVNPVTGTHYVVLPSPEKADSDNDDRNLIIAWMGWPTALAPSGGGGGADSSYLKFKPPGGAATEIWNLDSSVGENAFTPAVAYGDALPMSGAFSNYLYNDATEIVYTPHAANRFQVGEIETQNLQLAALSVWEAPMKNLSDAQELITQESVGAGMVIRGKGGNETSLGELIHRIGDGDDNVEAVESTTRRVWQFGHPVNWFTNSATYENVFGGSSSSFTIKWKPRQFGSVRSTVESRPFLVVTATNNGGDCFVKYTNTTAANDTWIWQGNNQNAAKITYTGGTPNSGIDTYDDVYNYIKIEAKAESGEELRIHTMGIEEPPPW